MSSVSKVDRLKVAERVRSAIAPTFGGTPGYKRRRGVLRALDRGDPYIVTRFQCELAMINMMNSIARSLYDSGS